jgi:four helix bundle protein
MHNYKNLKIWQKSMDLIEVIYQQKKAFPDEERYGLTSQLRRVAVSIPSNIAEVSSRSSKKEFYHFLSIALVSTYEVEIQIKLCKRIQLLEKDVFQMIMNKLDEIEKMIIGYMKTLISRTKIREQRAKIIL